MLQTQYPRLVYVLPSTILIITFFLIFALKTPSTPSPSTSPLPPSSTPTSYPTPTSTILGPTTTFLPIVSSRQHFTLSIPPAFSHTWDNPFEIVEGYSNDRVIRLSFAPDFQGSPCAITACDHSLPIRLTVGSQVVPTFQIWPYINNHFTFKAVIPYPDSDLTLTIFGRYQSETDLPLINTILSTFRFTN